MHRLCAAIVGALLAVMPALAHTCDFGCTGETGAIELPSPAASSTDCPLHQNQSGSEDPASAPQSSHDSTPCDHDGHDQAVGPDAAKVIRLTAHCDSAVAPLAGPAPASLCPIGPRGGVERPLRATAVTTRPVLRI